MDFSKYHNTIIITPIERKKELLEFRRLNPNINFKWFDKASFCQKILGKIDKEALIYLYRKGLTFKNAAELLKYIIFAKEGITSKIDQLFSLKNELIRENLLHINDLFLAYINKQKIIVFGYLSDDKELNFIKNQFHLDINFVNDKLELTNRIYEFNFFEDEIKYIFEQIGQLIKKSIDPSKIKIIIKDEKYLREIKKYSNFYNIPFNFASETTYDKTDEFKEFIDYIKSMLAIEAFNFFNEKSFYQKSFLKLFAKYLEIKDYINENEIVEYLTYQASLISVEPKKYKNGVSICDFKDCRKDDYIYVLGFCLGAYPKVSKDIDYLSDKEKLSLFISTSYDKQLFETYNIEFFLSYYPNIKISYSKKKGKEEFYPSKIIEKNHLQLEGYLFDTILYSKKHFANVMAKVFDNYDNFSFQSEYYSSCQREDIQYKNYNHRFKVFDYHNEKEIKIAYTDLQTFFECPFKYYLRKIIKADVFESSIYLKVGNVFHHLLEKKFKNEDYSIDEEIRKEVETPREEILLKALEPQFKFVLERMSQWEKDCRYHSFKSESDYFSYRLDDNSLIYGKIDLICQDDSNYSIIDFKTSDFKFDAREVNLGFSLQLPLYYLITSSDTSPLKDYNLNGLYILNTLSQDFYGGSRDYLKFNGITLEEKGYELMGGEQTYVKKPYGKDKYLFSKDNFELLKEDVVNLSKKAIIDIRNGNFIIQPKLIDNKNRSCDKCPFYDVCYHDYHDNLYLKKEEK